MAVGRKTGGRVAGTPNKATADVKAAASVYTDAALKELARIMLKSESDAARVSAIKELLDRAHGKPAQAVQVGGGDSPVEMVMRWAQMASEATQDPSAKS
jgi:hypothetical protein